MEIWSLTGWLDEKSWRGEKKVFVELYTGKWCIDGGRVEEEYKRFLEEEEERKKFKSRDS